MTLLEHLEALRAALIRALGFVLGAFVLCLAQSEKISEFLLSPLRQALPANSGKIVYLSVFDQIFSELQVSFWAAIIVSSPLWTAMLWRFISPALSSAEKKLASLFLMAAFLFFASGVYFGYWILLPMGLKVLLEGGLHNVEAMISLKQYLLTASYALVILGLMFELPIVMLILGLMGLINSAMLNELRRYIYVGFAVLAAAITPSTDAVSMLLLWVPLIVLFECGTLALWLLKLRKGRA